MALSYIGGKSRIGTWIRDYIPNDIETYVEPFSGMFWVFFKMELNKYPNLKTVVYNDLNPLNVNLFNCIRNYEDFYEVIKDYKAQDKKLFDKFQKEIFNEDFKVDLSTPDYHTASKYAYIISQVWSGTNPEKGKFIDLKGKYKSKFDSFKSKLVDEKWQNYFDKITICESLDFEEVIKKYDSEKTYFYCDPPYFKTEKYYANHDFGLSTHERLANSLKSISGKFSLSYYYFDNLSEWFPKNDYVWTSKEFSKAAMAKAGKSQTKGVELLIMNSDETPKPIKVKKKSVDVVVTQSDDDDFDFSI
jgi:DNA adenine methylase